MRTLLIDNYDSFTYNLFQLLSEVNGTEPEVVRNDEASWGKLAGAGFDNVVISPGPGRPERERDFGVCAEAIRRCEVPLLGVCLGHQGLGWVHGGRVEPAPAAMHGRISQVEHRGSPLFAGIPSPFRAVRYHSLCLGRPLPAALEEIACTEDGVAMAVAHRTRPQWGVQFHPESICTEHGQALLANFRDLTTGHEAPRRRSPVTVARRSRKRAEGDAGDLELRYERIDRGVDPELAFADLYGESPDGFWLDSSLLDGDARFSFMGDASGPHARSIDYDAGTGELAIKSAAGTETLQESIFDYLAREMRCLRRPCGDLPFDFNCGFVGYFGYELGVEGEGSGAPGSTLPDAHFILADRMIAFDHADGCAYVLGLAEQGTAVDLEEWIAETVRRLVSPAPIAASGESHRADEDEPVEFRLARSRGRYLDDIAACKKYLLEGETYEICLTNKITAEASPDPLSVYSALRQVNPAPFSAFLRIGAAAVLSSSPERFLAVGQDGWAEAKPIKGTSRRASDPAEDRLLAEELRRDEKNRAENLMVTDLLRNDLGAVCEIGSVHVAGLMEVETFETVHQLVSTVRGRLREDLEPPDCIRACFPAGSMTGAPKRRTMELIEGLEREPRGVYSGALGYLGLSGGCDLSVVIRTIVIDGASTTIGVGGAIVMQSDAEDEFDEALLKGRAPMQALDPRAASRFEPAPR
jgi:para-aminobenzoate synthetase